MPRLALRNGAYCVIGGMGCAVWFTALHPFAEQREGWASADDRQAQYAAREMGVTSEEEPRWPSLWLVNQRLLAAQNKVRDEAGLAPLRLDARLIAAAWVHARDCAARDFLSHTGSDASSVDTRVGRVWYSWARVGENASIQRPLPPGWPEIRTAEWAVQVWTHSPEERARILGPYRHTGGAFADTPTGKRYWVVVFAEPWPGSKSRETH